MIKNITFYIIIFYLFYNCSADVKLVEIEKESAIKNVVLTNSTISAKIISGSHHIKEYGISLKLNTQKNTIKVKLGSLTRDHIKDFSYTFEKLKYNSTYEILIYLKTDKNKVIYSKKFQIKTKPLELIAPINNFSTIWTQYLDLEWHATKDEKYDIYIGNSTHDLNNVIQNHATGKYTFSIPENFTIVNATQKYYWQITAKDNQQMDKKYQVV